MRCVFAGTPDVAAVSLTALLESHHDVVAVITRPDAPAGRGRSTAASPVAQLARDAGIEVLQPTTLRDPEVLDRLTVIDPDVAPIVAFGGLVPPAALTIPRHGWVNLHFSLLPQWRGAAPVQRAIMAGDDVTGACTFRIEAGLDTGPVFGTVTREIRPDDTAGSLLDALAHDGAVLLAQTLANIDAITPVPQPADGVSLAAKLTKEEAQVRWDLPALVIDRGIRGCTPDPGAWTVFGEQRLGLGPVVLRPDVDDLAPGAVRFERAAVLVGTGSHAVALQSVKPQGKGSMAATDWARGLRERPDTFGAA